jgi:hypothetical protein
MNLCSEPAQLFLSNGNAFCSADIPCSFSVTFADGEQKNENLSVSQHSCKANVISSFNPVLIRKPEIF